MYNLGMLSDKALQAVVLWLNGRYCAAVAAVATRAAAPLGRAPSPPNALARTTVRAQHSRLYSSLSSPGARPLNS